MLDRHVKLQCVGILVVSLLMLWGTGMAIAAPKVLVIKDVDVKAETGVF